MGWWELDMRYDQLIDNLKYHIELETDRQILKDVLVTAELSKLVVYYAVAHDDTRQVPTLAMIVLLDRSGNVPMVRVMTEYEHPFYYDFPAEWLADLSPTTKQDALDWRNNVRAKQAVNT